jgi:hypothetical protein
MDRLTTRPILAFCLAVLMTAVNGGVLALAASAQTDIAATANVSAAIETAVAVGQSNLLDACCEELDEVSQARQSAPTCKVGSSDCGGPLPAVSALSGGSPNLWAIAIATAHRDHLSEHQLRPPRF